jgi:hypothetical protein
LGGPTRKRGTLIELVLDIPYLMDSTGVIPPLSVLNEVLREGGNNGGMSPGTEWKPFEITEAEYTELVNVFLAANLDELKQDHPYAYFDRVIVDEELQHCKDYDEWLTQVTQKYKS